MLRCVKISFLTFLFTIASMGLKADEKFDTGGTVLLADNEYQTSEPDVVINEIHYDPDIRTELVEFIELHNVTSENINIGGWYFSDGISYKFPGGSILPAGSYIVVAEDPDLSREPVTVVQKYAANSNFVYGPFEGRFSNEGEQIVLRDAEGNKVDEVDYQLGFPWPTVGDSVPSNTLGNGHSIQLINPYIDNDLGGSWRSAYPTPTRSNASVYLDNTPPLIRQVKHQPKQPKSNEIVTITAKITDSDGVLSVSLQYQLVEPGSYIPVTIPNYPSTNPATIPNSSYENGWISSSMNDNGLYGDETAGDDIYTVQLPASLQRHRRLIRYRIVARDNASNSILVPYDDDPQPNFAFFVYDGVPAWRGAVNPNGPFPDNQVVTYSAELMNSLPVYHLLSRAIDVQNCQYNPSYDNTSYYFSGTLVYDGEVYDNVHYRIRAQYSAFQTGKEKWKFDFNRGHYFQARDDYGNKYQSKWDKMNIGTGTCPWWQYPHPGNNWDVGTRGMMLNEALAFRLYNMAGVPSSRTNYFHFRVIDNAIETSSSNQYEGDFWGLYLTIEHPDGAFLDEHGLPDGNVYRMDGGVNKSHQGRTQVDNDSDVWSFINTYSSRPNRSWWGLSVNLPNYYSSRAIGFAINDSDRRPESNCIYYHDSETNQWWMLPWDLDLTFEWGTHYTDWEHFRYSLSYSEYDIASRNRSRELLDLLFSSDQVWQVVEEIASIISMPYDGRTFVEANRAMWDYNPGTVKKGQFYEYNEFLTTKDWPGLIEYYKTFLSPTGFSNVAAGDYGVNALVAEVEDSDIPDTPVIIYTGSAEYPKDDLTFETSSFRDPQGSSTFGAMKWRIAEVEPDTPVSPTVEQTTNSIETLLESESSGWRYFPARTGEPSNPVDAWRLIGFDDRAWFVGQTSVGYGDNDDNTILSDMQNNYSSVYLRHSFTVSNLSDITELRLNVYVDDGCIIWINGYEVARLHVGSGFKTYNSLTDADFVSDAAWEMVILDEPENYLVQGENIIAIHVLNSSLTSSDLSIDVELIAETDSEEPDEGQILQNHVGRYAARPKYEIEALWESEEIASPEARTITIPASVVEPGHTYRIRCRMEDNSGRWSHWSAPVQFVAGEMPTDGLLSDLRITELMYNPAEADTSNGELDVDSENFEFIELQNIGVEPLNLYLVSFTNGIDFTFPDIEISSGEYIVVVQNRNAFESRYGSDINVAGEYIGRLNNAGERIELEDGNGRVIQDFDFRDDWYDTTDGEGFSLTIKDPTNQDPNSWNQKDSWRASSYSGGSPGRDDTGTSR